MAIFSIKRLRPSLQEKYKWAPVGAVSNPLKPNDFLDDGEVDGDSVYHAWAQLREESRDLRVGDVLVTPEGGIFVCTYSGFEEAQWLAVPGDGSASPEEIEVGPSATVPAPKEIGS